MEKKLTELLGSEEFMAKVNGCETQEKLLALFAENGVDMTPEELKAFAKKLDEPECELTDDELENIAGGGVRDLFESQKRSIAKTAEKLFG